MHAHRAIAAAGTAAFPWVEVVALIFQCQPGTAIYRWLNEAAAADGAPCSPTANDAPVLLREIVHRLDLRLWQAGGGQGEAPPRLDLPWTRPPDEDGDYDALDDHQLAAMARAKNLPV